MLKHPRTNGQFCLGNCRYQSFMQNGREAALFLLERGGGVCVRDGHKSNLLIFVRTAEIGNEVAVTK